MDFIDQQKTKPVDLESDYVISEFLIDTTFNGIFLENGNKFLTSNLKMYDTCTQQEVEFRL